MSTTEHYLKMALDLARQNAERGGRPFASVIVKDGKVVATAINAVAATGDPIAHAETEAIRAAAKALKSDQLDGCILYASGHPCPMCLAAMYVASDIQAIGRISDDNVTGLWRQSQGVVNAYTRLA